MSNLNSVDGKRVTQSYRLYSLFAKKSKDRRYITREKIMKTLNLKPQYVGSYISEFKRVYGADVVYNKSKDRYELRNQIKVPKAGLAGRQALSV
jgi:hypothetical protein